MAKKPRITEGPEEPDEQETGAAASTNDEDEDEDESPVPCRWRCAAGIPSGELTIPVADGVRTVQVKDGVTEPLPGDMAKAMGALGYQKFTR